MWKRKTIFLRLLVFSIVGALALSTISMFTLIRISDMVVEDYRYGYLMYIGRGIERSSETLPVSKINVNKFPGPPVPQKNPLAILHEINQPTPTPVKSLLPKSMQFPKSSPKPFLWLVSASGKIISANNQQALPLLWNKLPHPRSVHGMASTDNQLWEPKTFVLRLNTQPKTYLVSINERSLFQGPFLWIQGLHTFTTAALAVFLALSLSFFYLRRKSTEARKVLGRLEAGDLKARFEIKRFDEFGNLILDFNRMADEIERLVKRVNDTETSRSHLLQELGHDLRTPLTSLGTSFETLKFYGKQMTNEDREELFNMIDSDIRYFRELLEKLTIVATIDESHYKTSSEKINLANMLSEELRNRQTATGSEIHWHLYAENSESIIFGDLHLISRLFKNAFDNAARYAQSSINVYLTPKKEELEILIKDDGPGLSDEAIHAFGKRRERRQLKHKDPRNFSLGLGSVIMKTIAEVHDGEVEMRNSPEGGACLKVIFKRSA
jgi:signal transduction histidine kinase